MCSSVNPSRDHAHLLATEVNIHLHNRLKGIFLNFFEVRLYEVHSVSPTVDAGRHTPSLERQRKVLLQKLSSELLWIELAAKHV